MTVLIVLLLFLFFGCLVAAYLLQKPKSKPRVLPPPTTKRAEPSFQETNSLAKLFVEVVALKENAAKWPTILRGLNLEDEPHIRTLLLELRSHPANDPISALEAIESACIAARQKGQSPSRAELLGRALTVLQGDNLP